MADEKMVIDLPMEIVKSTTKSPKTMLIYSPPKTGKTSLLAGLEDSLLLDFEEGSTYVDTRKMKVDDLTHYIAIIKAIKEKGNPYRYLILDTVTGLEDMCLPLANRKYKATPMGANWKGTDVRTLANGAGYLYFRQAFEAALKLAYGAAERVIIVGHLKDKVLEKHGKEVNMMDIDLVGKHKSITCSKVDAIGFLYPDGNKRIMSFVSKETIICGARPHHLKNKEIVMSELTNQASSTTCA